MKSLNEQINDVKENKSLNRNAKKVALIKLGLPIVDANVLTNLWYKDEIAAARIAARERRENGSIAKLTFGVEIECVNAPREILLNNARERGLEINFLGYTHKDSRTAYKLVTDSSIEGENPIECVTPVLKGGRNGFASLKKMCEALKATGAKANRSTGLHVHVGYPNMTDEHYINVFKNYQKLEGIIDSFMAPSRRGNVCEWARTLTNKNFDNCISKSEVAFRLGTRYTKVNAEAWRRHQTIEFRQHQGSTNYEKISKWATFCLKLVLWSKNNVITEPITSIYDIPFLNDVEKSYFMSRNEYFASHND